MAALILGGSVALLGEVHTASGQSFTLANHAKPSPLGLVETIQIVDVAPSVDGGSPGLQFSFLPCREWGDWSWNEGDAARSQWSDSFSQVLWRVGQYAGEWPFPNVLSDPKNNFFRWRLTEVFYFDHHHSFGRFVDILDDSALDMDIGPQLALRSSFGVPNKLSGYRYIFFGGARALLQGFNLRGYLFELGGPVKIGSFGLGLGVTELIFASGPQLVGSSLKSEGKNSNRDSSEGRDNRAQLVKKLNNLDADEWDDLIRGAIFLLGLFGFFAYFVVTRDERKN